MNDFDVIIRDGMIIDGQRTPRYRGDIGIKNGQVKSITGVGGLSRKSATRVIEAEGLVVAPGFVDLHTHYDAQIFWDPYCTTSGWHGVTSVVIGNCGFGIAPVKKEGQQRAMLSLTRNEAISYDAMNEALAWDWESFPEFMDAIEKTPKGINLLTYIPLSPLIAYVMGGVDNAKTRRPSANEMAEIKQLITEAMDAGACGISSQYLGETSVQRDYDGTPNVTDVMHFDDFLDMVSVLKDMGRGAIQVLGLTQDQTERVCEASGAMVIYNVLALECDQHGLKTEGSWEDFTDWMVDANKRGLKVSAQAVTTGIDFVFTFEDWNLYDFSPHWRNVCMGTTAEKLEKMQDPEIRAAIRQEYDGVANATREDFQADLDSDVSATALVQFRTVGDNSVQMVDNDDLIKYEGMTIRQIAAQENKHVCDAILDIAVADKLRTTFATPPNHYDPEDIKKLINKPHTIPGISDGGAHMKFSAFGRYGTEYLVHYVRDGKMVDLEYAHWHLSSIPAQYAGLHDRGVIRVGNPADILVYDLNELGWTEAEKAYDLPAGDWRRITKGLGYRYTLVNGDVTFINGENTGATPGHLLRNGHA
tara:strand:- start:2103 stop:3866 length:1764 start_codon:yes stop_codon:yes gene_type:complete